MSDYSQFLKKLQQLNADYDKVAQRVVNRAVNEGFDVTVTETPVGQYDRLVVFKTRNGETVKFERSFVPQGGTLQKGWEIKPTQRIVNGWQGGYFNNVEYGIYVNFGHRLVSKGRTVGYVPGRFFLEAGVNHVRRNMQDYFRNEIQTIRGDW